MIEALQVMPGIGPVSATRIAYYLLDRKREGGLRQREVITRQKIKPTKTKDIYEATHNNCSLNVVSMPLLPSKYLEHSDLYSGYRYVCLPHKIIYFL